MPVGKRILVKVQSVRTIPMESTGAGFTIGEQIDNLLRDCVADEWNPNKLTIDLDPPEELPNNRMPR